MNNPLKMEENFLIQSIHNAYGLSLQNLNFLLRGWGGDCYSGDDKNGTRYFLKLHDETDFLALAVSSKAFFLPLMDQLHRLGILPHVPCPVHTKSGAFSLQIAPYEVVITNFIAGNLVGFGQLPGAVFSQLAKLVGILHHSIAQLAFEHPFIDQFEINYEVLLLRLLQDLEKVTHQDRRGQQNLREQLTPWKADILTLLEHQKNLQTYARTADVEMVICHTDLHGANLMTNQAGDLFILDWENAIIAPPEHDLFFFVGDERFWDHFLPIYREYNPALELDVKIFEFYFLRRFFEDVTDFILRIMNGEGSTERDQDDLREIMDYIHGQDKVQKTLLQIQKKIDGD